MLVLGMLRSGERAEVVTLKMNEQKTLNKGKCCCKMHRELTRLESMGIREGKIVEVIQNCGRGLILCKINNATYAIEKRLAMKIIVKII